MDKNVSARESEKSLRPHYRKQVWVRYNLNLNTRTTRSHPHLKGTLGKEENAASTSKGALCAQQTVLHVPCLHWEPTVCTNHSDHTVWRETDKLASDRKLVLRKLVVIGSPVPQAILSSVVRANGKAFSSSGICERGSSQKSLHLLDHWVLRLGAKCASQWPSIEGLWWVIASWAS